MSESLAAPAIPASSAAISNQFARDVHPLLEKYCLQCHAAKTKKGDLDLERFASAAQVQTDLPTWQKIVEKLEAEEMPPDEAKIVLPPTERARIIDWAKRFIAEDIGRRAGDPGRVIIRRLSNAEYDNTIRDLTGLDLQPAREFPTDGAAGEGFTNTGDALVMSPVLLGKYLAAAKQIAAHAVLPADGLRFSPATTRRDWTDEAIAELRKAYGELDRGNDGGKLNFQPYLAATVKYRDDLMCGKIDIATVAANEKLNAKYLQALWSTLTAKDPGFPLDEIQSHWRAAAPKDVDGLANEIRTWQARLWRFDKIGSYVSLKWQQPATPTPVEKLDPKQEPAKASSVFVASEAVRKFGPKKLEDGFVRFRDCFPQFVHHPRIVPDDEVICLRMYFREDDYLKRLFLSGEEQRRLDRLWTELLFVSQEWVLEQRNYPSFIGFVTQENSKEKVKELEDKIGPGVRQRADDFQAQTAAAEPKQLDAVLEFAGRAYRRPLDDAETQRLLRLYAKLRKKGLPADEAMHDVLTAVLISPAFLYRSETPSTAGEAQPVNNWELATRLSYFLWASTPDDPLRRLAASGRLTEPDFLAAEAMRMLHDDKARGLATEFAAQWLHVRDIRQNHEKNERLFPTFNDDLRGELFEESIQFLQDLMQNDRSVLNLIDCDYTFLNEPLARHYGIPNVQGPQWRRVDGVKKYGRGGAIALGSVLTQQSAASRTSPILRGNWVLETLLGEKLPKPPANVPILPEEETATKDETMRQIVEKHTKLAKCAKCHQRIDPLGFSLEAYDAIGRFRDRDLAGRPIDCKVTLKDGVKFEGLDGLRHYLLDSRRDDVLRVFCRKLAGYALARSLTLTDEPLVDEMLGQLKQHDYRFSAALVPLVRSKQFRYHRQLAATREE